MFEELLSAGQTGGLQGKAGTGLAAVIRYLGGATTVDGLNKRQHQGMISLGLLGSNGQLAGRFVDASGNLQLEKVITYLEGVHNDFARHGRQMQFQGYAQDAFQTQGANYLANRLNTPQYEQAHKNIQRMTSMGGVDSMFHSASNTFIYQASLAMTNLGNVFKAFFLPMLPSLTSMFSQFGAQLQKLANYVVAHPQFAKDLGTIFARLAKTGLGTTITLVTTFVKVIDRLDEGMNKLVPVATLVTNVFEGMLAPLQALVSVGAAIGNFEARITGAMAGAASGLGVAVAGGGGSQQRQAARLPGAPIRVSGGTRTSPRTPHVWSNSTVHG
jgi:hypothetical protein